MILVQRKNGKGGKLCGQKFHSAPVPEALHILLASDVDHHHFSHSLDR